MNIGQKQYGATDLYGTRLGKFEANRSERMSEMLYTLNLENCLDDEAGSVGEVGIFYGLVNSSSHRGGWIIEVTEQGFFSYTFYPHHEGELLTRVWNTIKGEVNALFDYDD